MKLIAYDAVSGVNYEAWTTEAEPDAGLVVIVPAYDQGGNPITVEVCVGKLSLKAAFGGAA